MEVSVALRNGMQHDFRKLVLKGSRLEVVVAFSDVVVAERLMIAGTEIVRRRHLKKATIREWRCKAKKAKKARSGIGGGKEAWRHAPAPGSGRANKTARRAVPPGSPLGDRGRCVPIVSV